MDRGFFISLQAVRRQLAAMPAELYQLRLIDGRSRRPFPAASVWSACQLGRGAMVSFLRARNCEGFDVYIRPYAGDHGNAGYILLDLDVAAPGTIAGMRANGHEPCVVVQSSAGHLQAWVRVSPTPLEPAVASAIGQHLASLYGGDLASSDWRHFGRLAGFTNQKPTRRQPSGYAPWVRLVYAQAQRATNASSLMMQAAATATRRASAPRSPAVCGSWTPASTQGTAGGITPTGAAAIYDRFLQRLRIRERFPQPDWSIADLWIAKELFRCRTSTPQVFAILRLGSPGFPRGHSHPEDYLARTVRRAILELQSTPTAFPARRGAPRVEASGCHR